MNIKRFFDKVANKIDWKFIHPLNAKRRRDKLKSTSFTVISNNCWAGRLYEYFNLPKQTPTVGLYFFADEYVKFCKNLKEYLSKELVLIELTESKHYEDICAVGDDKEAIVGQLGDIEVVFLHYKDRQVILDKWKRRIQRIDWNHIILKFSYQNNCTDELIREFMSIKEYPKICFCGEKIEGCPDVLIYPRHNGKVPVDETQNYDRFFNIVKLINSRLEKGEKGE